MIKVKLTKYGGYITGDGDLPEGFNADAFMKEFASKMIDNGIEELDVAEEEIAMFMDGVRLYKEDVHNEISNAPIRVYDDSYMNNPEKLLMELDTRN